MEETQIPKVMPCREHGEKEKNKTFPLNKLKLRGMISLVKRIPKEKTF